MDKAKESYDNKILDSFKNNKKRKKKKQQKRCKTQKIKYYVLTVIWKQIIA